MEIFTAISIIIILGYFLLRHMDGDFTISSEEIIVKGLLIGKNGKTMGNFYIIKRVYQSNRIKIIRKNIRN